MELKEALKEIREKSEKRKFEQSVDLIVNLKGIDTKKDNISAIISLPHKFKDKRVCGFLAKKSEVIRTITPPDFIRFRDKKELKKLVKEFDFFIASAPLMQPVATTFGKILGPSGKMPSPQLGILIQENDDAIRKLIETINKSVKIKAKEPSIKLVVGKENMKDNELEDNIRAVYNGIVNALPTKRENVKNVEIKFTMGKPVKVEIK